MHPARTLAPLVFSLVLAACGGGGGGDAGGSASAGGGTAPLGGGSATGAGASGSTGTATAFAPLAVFGPVTVGQLPAAQASARPAVARLARGGLATTWLEGDALRLQVVDAAGAPVGGPRTVAATPLGRPLFDVAGLAGGDIVVAWAVSTLRASTPGATTVTVSQQRFAPDGTPRGPVTEVDPQLYWVVTDRLVVEALPDGGHVVGWTAAGFRTEPTRAMVRRFGADGSPAGATQRVGGNGLQEGQLCIAPLDGGAMAVAWTREASGGSLSAFTRTLEASGAPAGPEREVAATIGASGATGLGLTCAAASGSAYALGWRAPGQQANWALYDRAGAPQTAVATSPLADDFQLVSLGRSGFARVTQFIDGTTRTATARLSAQAFDATGAPSGPAQAGLLAWTIQGVDQATGGSTPTAPRDFGVAGGPDGRLAVGYHEAATAGVQVRIAAR